MSTGSLAVRASRSIWAAALVFCLGASVLMASADAGPKSLSVHGRFNTPTFTGPTCASPVGVCFKGDFKGSLRGTAEGFVRSASPTQQPGVDLGDASVVVHEHRGDLACDHQPVVFSTSPTSSGEFAWLCEITSGTGYFAGASGYLQGLGTATPGTTKDSGSYVGKIVLP